MKWVPVETVRDTLGLPEAAASHYQQGLVMDEDLKKHGRVWMWSERACVALAASLGVGWPDGKKNAAASPAPQGERLWHVYLCPANRRIVLAAEKGARPRDVRETVRVRVPDNARLRPGQALRCVRLHDDLWDLVEVVRPERNQVRPNASQTKVNYETVSSAVCDAGATGVGTSGMALELGGGGAKNAGRAGVAQRAAVVSDDAAGGLVGGASQTGSER